MLSRMTYALVDVFFPSRCVSCGNPVSSRYHGLCSACRDAVETVMTGCPRCGSYTDGSVCGRCLDREFFPAGCTIISEYSGTMKDLVRALKFRRDLRVVPVIAGLAVDALDRGGVSCECITAVPMNRSKKRKRGFNQAEVVGRRMSSMAGIPYHDVLRERKGTGSQKRMDLPGRFIHVLGRFHVTRPVRVRGRRVLLVDDIMTTGATVNECARLLLESGAREVHVLTFARADIKDLKIGTGVVQ